MTAWLFFLPVFLSASSCWSGSVEPSPGWRTEPRKRPWMTCRRNRRTSETTAVSTNHPRYRITSAVLKFSLTGVNYPALSQLSMDVLTVHSVFLYPLHSVILRVFCFLCWMCSLTLWADFTSCFRSKRNASWRSASTLCRLNWDSATDPPSCHQKDAWCLYVYNRHLCSSFLFKNPIWNSLKKVLNLNRITP